MKLFHSSSYPEGFRKQVAKGVNTNTPQVNILELALEQTLFDSPHSITDWVTTVLGSNSSRNPFW